MIRFAWQDVTLMKFLGVDIREQNIPQDLFEAPNDIPDDAILLDDGFHYAIKHKNNKDKGQRILCGCMVSKDIGEYNTCPHQCEYCYANTSKEKAIANHMSAINSGSKGETITGK